MSSRRRVPRHLPSGRGVSGHLPSGRRVSRQMSSGRRMPRHLPSGRGVSGHLPSGRSACLTDAECQGKCLPDEEFQGICLLDAKCQGKWDPDEAYDGAPHTGNRAVTVVASRRDCQGTVHSIKHAFGSRHCDSIQFYSLHISYIYIPHLAYCTIRRDEYNEDAGVKDDETRHLGRRPS